MKELIKRNDVGMFVADKDKSVRVNSKYVAEVFDKSHFHVLRDIDSILKSNSLSEEFRKSNFGLSSYITPQNKKCKCYELTRDGFMILVMGYTGDKAMKLKEWYINQFNAMENQLQDLLGARLECPKLTNALLENGKNEWYHYSNEFNMINSLVLGMSTKKFRELNDIPTGESIRPYLSDGQLKLIREMQNYDTVLIDMVGDFATRKAILKTKFIDKEC